MAFIEWRNEYSVNVSEIDGHHKKLISYMNELQTAMKDGKGRTVIEEILMKLNEYTIFHFSFEEKYMKEFDYELFDEHKSQHEYFIKKIDEFNHEFIRENKMLSVKVLSFLVEWLITHISESDTKYSKLFNEKGLK